MSAGLEIVVTSRRRSSWSPTHRLDQGSRGVSTRDLVDLGRGEGLGLGPDQDTV